MSGDSNLSSIVPFNHLDDSLFNLVLYEMSYGPVIYDGDIPESLKFDPIDQPELGNMLSSYLDPDSYVESRLPCITMSLRKNLVIKLVLQITLIHLLLCILILVVCF